MQEGYRTGGMMRTFATVIKNEGFFALYKGLLPPLIGSGTLARATAHTMPVSTFLRPVARTILHARYLPVGAVRCVQLELGHAA